MTTIQFSRAHYPITVLGPGSRIAVWMQGCSIGCPGCIAHDTWPADGGAALPVGALLTWCKQISAGRPDGVTITGGEPFDQPAALHALLLELRAWRDADGLDFDLLAYSGYPLAMLQARHADTVALLDALIPEPFQHHRPRAHVWRGSDNQPLVPLTPLGVARYAPFVDAAPDGRGTMQVAVSGTEIWYAGVPDRGDMTRASRNAAAAGVLQEGPAWRS